MRYLVLLLLIVITSGCSVFMPYKENFACNIDGAMGYCGSLNDVYEYSLAIEKGER